MLDQLAADRIDERTVAKANWTLISDSRLTKAARVSALIAVLMLAALPAVASRDIVQNLTFIFTMLALAQLWNALSGWGGLISVGQQAFVGVGAYTFFGAVALAGLDPISAICCAALTAALVGAAVGPLLFRLEGPHFAVGTWVVAELLKLICSQIKSLGGGTGMSLPSSTYSHFPGLEQVQAIFGVRTVFARDILVYWISLAFVIAITFAVYRFVKSSLGLALAAARDNPRAARSVGVRTNHIRHLLWIAIAAATGVVGAVIYLQKARLSPDAAFNVVDWTAYVLFIVVIGGIRTIEGPFVGVLVLWALVYFLSQYGPLYLLLLGAMAILTMLFLPGGVWGFVADRYNIQLFPTSRRLRFDPIDGAYPVRKKRSSGDEAVRPSSASD